jgi:AcrR family transcriptional regulator
MSDRLDDPLLAAAFSSFARYGYARTTMSDIATAAGMSRPAVYLRVRNKDELLRAVGAELLRSSTARAEAAAGDGALDLGARIEGVLLAKLDLILDLAARSEHAVELLGAHARVDADGSAAYTATIEALAARPLAERVPARQAREIAAMLTRCVMGFEADLDDPRAARARLHLLIDLVMAGLPAASPDRRPRQGQGRRR